MTEKQTEIIKTVANYGTPIIILLIILFGVWRTSEFLAPKVETLFSVWVENIEESTELWKQIAESAAADADRQKAEHEWLEAQTEVLTKLANE